MKKGISIKTDKKLKPEQKQIYLDFCQNFKYICMYVIQILIRNSTQRFLHIGVFKF